MKEQPWSEDVEGALQAIHGNSDKNLGPLQAVLESVQRSLGILAYSVLQGQAPLRRKKPEHLISEFVHKRDVTRRMIRDEINSPRAFQWLSQMRFYFDPKQDKELEQLSINTANAKFHYGLEYVGFQEKLI